MDLAHFCRGLQSLKLDNRRQALSLLWFHDEKNPDVTMSAGQLAKIIHDTGLGNPHSTQLGESIRQSGSVIATSSGFRLKTLARSEVRSWLTSILGAKKPSVDQDLGYLPREIWKDTRGYIEKVCVQLNGCFQFEFYDAASVLVRRLIETLIIECYEHLKREAEIKGADGNYLMLKGLVAKATGACGLALGRDAHRFLKEVKELGDRSAHNRRYNAVKADLEKIQSGVRVAVDEMFNLSCLRKTT
jgi:hypothetical protein